MEIEIAERRGKPPVRSGRVKAKYLALPSKTGARVRGGEDAQDIKGHITGPSGRLERLSRFELEDARGGSSRPRDWGTPAGRIGRRAPLTAP